MFRRFLLGLLEGLSIGIALALAAVRGLGLATPGAWVAALLAAGVGFLVGLVAGRPIWAKNAKIEALLKAGAGALVAALLSLAARRWLHAPVDLSEFSLGIGPVGELTAVSLPAIACALSLFFELDDSNAATPPTEPVKARVTAAPREFEELTELEGSDEQAQRKLEQR